MGTLILIMLIYYHTPILIMGEEHFLQILGKLQKLNLIFYQTEILPMKRLTAAEKTLIHLVFQV